jgi:hypothetical protein
MSTNTSTRTSRKPKSKAKGRAAEPDLAPMSRNEFDRVVATLTEPQVEAYQKCRKRNEANQFSDLANNWEFGKLVSEVSSDVNTYGANFIATLARLLNLEISYLYKRLKFFNVFSFDEMARLKEMRTSATNTPLTWTHVQAVLSLESSEDRWNLLELACENNWTPGMLTQHARQRPSATADNRRGKTGRPAKVPQTVDGKLAQMRETLPLVVKRATFWSDATDGLLANIRSVAPEKISPAWLREVQNTLESLAQLEESTASCRAQLTDAETYLASLLRNRKARPGKAAVSVTDGDDLFEDEA